MKKVLILCTGNSCRSIIAEALINKYLSPDIIAFSSGVKASGQVNPNAKKILEQNDCWNDKYHSKVIEDVLDINYDLVVTVCSNANESCPIFPKNTKVIHIGFEDPDKQEYQKFINTYNDIKKILLPKVKEQLI